MHAQEKIAVIGAGLSGLTAAYRLQQKGCDVEVYEARNRVGGRVFTVNVGGHLAELGGQNILDGGDAPHMVALMQELGLEEVTKQVSQELYFDFEGNFFSFRKLLLEYNFTPESLNEKLQPILQTAQNMRDVVAGLFEEESVLFRACCTILAGYEGGAVDKLSVCSTETLKHLLLGGLSSTHPYSESGIEHMMIKGGNALLAESLADKLTVHLNSPLQALRRDSDGTYRLLFADGKETSADIVILTIPSPTFSTISFDASVIPPERREQIETLLFGNTEKIVIERPMANTQKGGVFANDRMVTFDNRDHHLINLYYLGDHDSFTAETIGNVFSRELPFLEKAYGYTDLTQPVVASEIPFSSYDCPVGHSWVNDPYARGSYSYIPADQEESFLSTIDIGDETVKALFAPIGNTLFFAGEHTSTSIEIMGTMEAAVETGDKAARMVLNP